MATAATLPVSPPEKLVPLFELQRAPLVVPTRIRSPRARIWLTAELVSMLDHEVPPLVLRCVPAESPTIGLPFLSKARARAAVVNPVAAHVAPRSVDLKTPLGVAT